MLVLSRKVDETIAIGEDIVLKVLSINGKCVKIGITAPSGVRIRRSEIEIEISSEDEVACDLPQEPESEAEDAA